MKLMDLQRLCRRWFRLHRCPQPGSWPPPPHQREELMLLQSVQSTECTDGDGRIVYREFSDMVKMENKPKK